MFNSGKKTIGGVLTYLWMGIHSAQALEQQNLTTVLPYLGSKTQPVVHKKSPIVRLYNNRSQRIQYNAHSAPGRASNQAVAMLERTSEQWLNQWGHAEINLSNDGRGLPQRQGHINALFPWYHNEQQLWFTQWGVSRTSDHTTLNFGIGQRWLHPIKGHWGYNLFYDQRIQGSHRRLGIGLEQYYDTQAIAINGYLPLSGWRTSTQQDELIQAARGIDIRLKSYLARYPQLSFSLAGERYFGANVSLMGQKKQQIHPTALSVGIEYTPIPLLSAGYDFKLGQAGQHDHQLHLNLSYRLGVPLVQQLDPSRVANTRSLAASRLALVQRNQHIVLHHKPNDRLQLQLSPEKISAQPGEHITFTVNITSPRPLKEWQRSWGGTVLTAGGEVTANAAWTQATVTLPMTPGRYTLHLDARNARGVHAQSNSMEVEVLQPPAPNNVQVSDGTSVKQKAEKLEQKELEKKLRQAKEKEEGLRAAKPVRNKNTLQLPDRLEGQADEQITFPVTVKTQQLSQWSYTWAGTMLDAAREKPQSNQDWTQATLTLPLTAGLYDLYLKARNTHGIEIQSNTMPITVLTP